MIRLKETPLTRDELFEMDGMPVWAVTIGKNVEESGWALACENVGYSIYQGFTKEDLWYSDYGVTWVAFKKNLIVE